MLVVFAGLPGTGKTTIAKMVTEGLLAFYLRIDTIEQAMIASGDTANPMDDRGYKIAYAIAKENMKLGATVVVDAVNPIQLVRDAWYAVAKETDVPCCVIELRCENKVEHKKRIEERAADIENHKLPTWQDVLNREYQIWENADLKIDTSARSVSSTTELILRKIRLVKEETTQHHFNDSCYHNESEL